MMVIANVGLASKETNVMNVKINIMSQTLSVLDVVAMTEEVEMEEIVTMADVLASLNMMGTNVIPVPMDSTKVGLNVTLATAITEDQGPPLVVTDNAIASLDMLVPNVKLVHNVTFVVLAVSKTSE